MEKLIEIINYIDNHFDYIDIDDLYMNDNYIKEFNELSDILDTINLDNDMLHNISKIGHSEIFYQEIGTKFTNNTNRKKIVEYLENDNLYIDYYLKFGNQLALFNKAIFYCEIIKCKNIFVHPYSNFFIHNTINDQQFNLSIEIAKIAEDYSNKL